MAFIKIVTRNVKFNSFLILNSAKIKNKMALKIVTLFIAAKYIHTFIIYSYIHSTTLYILDIGRCLIISTTTTSRCGRSIHRWLYLEYTIHYIVVLDIIKGTICTTIIYYLLLKIVIVTHYYNQQLKQYIQWKKKGMCERHIVI